MKSSISITHEITSYNERIKNIILLFIGAVSLFGIFCFLDGDTRNIELLLLIMSILFGVIALSKILKSKFYIADFISDSKDLTIVYFNRSKEQKLVTKLENVKVKIKNTTAKTNFNFEIILFVNELKFTIDKDFDWSFTEMKQLFEYVRFHNNIVITDREKDLLSRIDSYIEKNPF